MGSRQSGPKQNNTRFQSWNEVQLVHVQEAGDLEEGSEVSMVEAVEGWPVDVVEGQPIAVEKRSIVSVVRGALKNVRKTPSRPAPPVPEPAWNASPSEDEQCRITYNNRYAYKYSSRRGNPGGRAFDFRGQRRAHNTAEAMESGRSRLAREYNSSRGNPGGRAFDFAGQQRSRAHTIA